MRIKSLYRRGLALFLLSTMVSPSFPVQAESEKPYLSAELQEKLQNLPYGLSDQKSLFLRNKHIDSVQFFGSGLNSRFSYQRDRSILAKGLSLRLVQTDDAHWANGVIQFERPMDLTPYNSIVLWVWTSHPKMKLSLGIRGNGQSQTPPLPALGLPSNEPLQLVIPFSAFTQQNKVVFSKISQISIEFGESTGNPLTSVVQVLGIAFVKQKQIPPSTLVVLGRTRAVVAADNKNTTVSRAVAKTTKPAAVIKKPVVKDEVPVTPPPPAPLLTTSDAESEIVEFPIPGSSGEYSPPSNAIPPSTEDPVEHENPSHEWLQSYLRSWPAQSFSRQQNAVEPGASKSHRFPFDWLLLVLTLILSLLWIPLVLRRRRTAFVTEQLGKVMHEIHWPFSITQPVLHKRVEREFWKGVAAQQERFGWLSTTGLAIEKTATPTEYFGEPFLRRQIQLAAKAGIALFPSLSFTNTVFRKDAMHSNLERSSTVLRTLVIETLLRFAEVAGGVRIENAVDLLNSRLRRKSKPPKFEEETESDPGHEFWADVIGAVKSKRPNFIFVADATGDQSKLIRQVGFDYYEQDMVTNILMDQIREGRVGDLQAFLRGGAAQFLKQSVYNLTPLLKPLPKKEIDRHQHVLAAILLTLIPGVAQHDNSMPEDLSSFINRLARSSVVRKGKFTLLSTSSPSVLAFARWRKKTLLLTVANFSNEVKNVTVNLASLNEGFDNNKLYLFNNALHGSAALKSLINQPDAGGPALALWGQNLRDTGLPLSMPALGLGLFSVTLTKPITNASIIPEPSSSTVESLS